MLVPEDPNSPSGASAGTDGSAPSNQPAGTPPAQPTAGNEPPGSAPGGTPATSPEPGPDSGTSKVVEELKHVRKRAQTAESEAAYWRGVAEGRSNAGAPPPQAPPSAPQLPPEPNPQDPKYENNWDLYERDRLNWVKDTTAIETEQRIMRTIETREATRAAEQTEAEAKRSFQTRLDEAAKVDPTIYDYVRDQTIPINQTMGQIIMRSTIGPKLLKYLGDNRDVAYRLATMDPLSVAREFGLLEAKMTIPQTPAAGTPPEPQKISQTPAPIQTVDSSSGPTNTTDMLDLPVDEYVARMNALEYGK